MAAVVQLAGLVEPGTSSAAAGTPIRVGAQTGFAALFAEAQFVGRGGRVSRAMKVPANKVDASKPVGKSDPTVVKKDSDSGPLQLLPVGVLVANPIVQPDARPSLSNQSCDVKPSAATPGSEQNANPGPENIRCLGDVSFPVPPGTVSPKKAPSAANLGPVETKVDAPDSGGAAVPATQSASFEDLHAQAQPAGQATPADAGKSSDLVADFYTGSYSPTVVPKAATNIVNDGEDPAEPGTPSVVSGGGENLTSVAAATEPPMPSAGIESVLPTASTEATVTVFARSSASRPLRSGEIHHDLASPGGTVRRSVRLNATVADISRPATSESATPASGEPVSGKASIAAPVPAAAPRVPPVAWGQDLSPASAARTSQVVVVPPTSGGVSDRSGRHIPQGDNPTTVADRESVIATPLVHDARILSRPEQTEMHIGLQTATFGNVEVHAVVRDGHVGVTIGSDRGDLSGWMTHEVPRIAGRLEQQDLRLDGLRFLEPTMSFQSGAGHSQSWTPHHGSSRAYTLHAKAQDEAAPQPSESESDLSADGALNIHA